LKIFVGISVADPGSGTFLTPGSGMGKKSGSGMNNPYHISESLETIFGVKILKFFEAHPGWKKFESGIRDKHPGSSTLVGISVADLDPGSGAFLTPGPRSGIGFFRIFQTHIFESFVKKWVKSYIIL
jgi:hypothetical protein